MKRYYFHQKVCKLLCTFGMIALCIACPSCDDGYYIDEQEPEWLGESIYNYLQSKQNFTYITQIIDSLNYKDVLSKTGSKTLFVADDEAFDRFFKDEDNLFGVHRFEDLSLSQMKMILYSSMINNAQLIELLANIEGPENGRCLRRATALSVLDSIPYEQGENLPPSSYWDRFRTSGIRLAKDNTSTPMVHLLPIYMQYQRITERDFCYLTNRDSLVEGGSYVNGKMVIKQDITCKNGYIHQLEDVALPLRNMAEIIRTTENTKMFSHLLERFCAPYYSASLTENYNRINQTNDSVFIKRYFADHSNTEAGSLKTDPNGNIVAGTLLYDPGWNTYTIQGVGSIMEEDMAAMFVPTDDAINAYFEEGGKFLQDRYGSWENIPDHLIEKLINNHMKTSFIGSVPSRFNNVMNDAQIEMGVKAEDINKVYFGSNGIVYVMNAIYPPISYIAVSAPTLVNENMQILNWAIEELQFYAYLLSMDSYYSFIIPTDNALKRYIDPVSMGKAIKNCFEFKYDEVKKSVYAIVHAYDPDTDTVGDSIRLASDKEVLDRLEDILDYHIIVGNIEDGKKFYLTKGGGSIKINGTGEGMGIQGGYQIENNIMPTIHTIYDQSQQGNGKAYVIDDAPLQSSIKSVYKILGEHEEFKDFFELLTPDDDSTNYITNGKYNIFQNGSTWVGLDLNVKFFNTYHYTIYVPTNEAVKQAIKDGLPTWDKILAEGDLAVRDSMANILTKFLRYHFQDNAIYIDGANSNNIYYETASVDDEIKRFYKLGIQKDNNNLYICDNLGRNAKVVTDNPNLYNIMARDYQFNGGSSSTDIESVSLIETSSWTVIHQIDKVLLYKDILSEE